MFDLVSKKTVNETLGALCRKFSTAIQDEKITRTYLTEAAKELLSSNNQIDYSYPTRKDVWLILLSHLHELSGIVATENIGNGFEQVDMEDEKAILIPNSIPIEKCTTTLLWEQKEFLKVNLYIFLDLYARVAKDNVASIPTPKEKLLCALRDELWVTVNALLVVEAYVTLLNKIDTVEKVEAFVTSFLQSIQKHLPEMDENIDDLCVPCGFKNHAMYMRFVFKQNRNDKDKKYSVEILIDNLATFSPGRAGSCFDKVNNKLHPHVVTVIDDAKDIGENKKLTEYLKKTFLLRSKNWDSAGSESIYNCTILENRIELSELAKKIKDYPSLHPQKVNNCVTANFIAGMKCRLFWLATDCTLETLYKWMLDEMSGFAMRNKEFESLSDFQIRNVEKFKAENHDEEKSPLDRNNDDRKLKASNDQPSHVTGYGDVSSYKSILAVINFAIIKHKHMQLCNCEGGKRKTIERYIVDNRNCYPKPNRLGTDINENNYEQAKLCELPLCGLDFSNINFKNSCFSFSNLSQTILKNTQLENANLTWARGLSGKQLGKAVFQRVIINDNRDVNNLKFIDDAAEIQKLRSENKKLKEKIQFLDQENQRGGAFGFVPRIN